MITIVYTPTIHPTDTDHFSLLSDNDEDRKTLDSKRGKDDDMKIRSDDDSISSMTVEDTITSVDDTAGKTIQERGGEQPLIVYTYFSLTDRITDLTCTFAKLWQFNYLPISI